MFNLDVEVMVAIKGGIMYFFDTLCHFIAQSCNYYLQLL